MLPGFRQGNKLTDHECLLLRGTDKKVFYKIFRSPEEIGEVAINSLMAGAIAPDGGHETIKKIIFYAKLYYIRCFFRYLLQRIAFLNMPNILPERPGINLSKTFQAYQAAVNEAAIVSITDIRGNILFVNNNFIEISKYSAEELIGRNHRIVNSGHHPHEFFEEMWRTISGGTAWRGEIKNRAKDGSYYWVDTVITPVMDENNRIFQYLSVRNLITTQKENEEKLILYQQELIKRQQQLKDAQQVAKTGSWYMDIAANTVEWSEETYRIFEIPPKTPVTSKLFMSKVHADDRELVRKNWLEGILIGAYEAEHRINTPSGQKWVRERARLEFDTSAKLVKAIGTIQDISERKANENNLRESENLYKNLFNNSPFPNGILEKDTLRFLEVNETAVRVYGYSREEFLKLTPFDIRLPEDHEKLKSQLRMGSYGRDTSIRAHKKKNGEMILAEPYITEIFYMGKLCYLITIHDVTEKIQMQEELIQTKINRQKEINRVALEAQEKNREEIGRELHDNVNQLLVASNMYLKNVQIANERDKELVDKSIQILNAAIVEIRKLSWALVPPSLDDLSLRDSIEELSQVLKLAGTAIEYDINIRENILAKGLRLNIYRIVQEQFNNIIKYAGATNAKVSMTQQNNLLTLEVSDNGNGFDLKAKHKGIGLANITQRAETYNGKVSIESSPGNGCRIYVEFILSGPDSLLQ